MVKGKTLTYLEKWGYLRKHGLILNTVRTGVQAFTILILLKIAYYFYIEDLSNVKIEGSLIVLSIVIGLVSWFIREYLYKRKLGVVINK